jgi:hypothetical protein
LLWGQAGAEVPADGLPVDRPGAPERVLAVSGENGEAGPAVGLVGLALGQAGGGQFIDDPAHPGTAEHRPLAQLAHPQPVVGRGVQFQQHVIPRQRDLCRGSQIRFHRRNQPAVGHQQAAPRLDNGVFGHAASLAGLRACVRTYIMCVRTHFY